MEKIPNKDHADKSLAELATLYNSLVTPKKRVKRFSDKETALKRIAKAFEEEPSLNARLEEKAAEKAAKKKPFKKRQHITEDLTLGKDTKLQVDIEVSEGNQPQTFLVGRKSKFSGKYIYKTEAWKDKNPRKPGTHGFYSWQKLVDGMSYEEFIRAKGGQKHLDHDVNKGFVVLENQPRKNQGE